MSSSSSSSHLLNSLHPAIRMKGQLHCILNQQPLHTSNHYYVIQGSTLFVYTQPDDTYRTSTHRTPIHTYDLTNASCYVHTQHDVSDRDGNTDYDNEKPCI